MARGKSRSTKSRKAKPSRSRGSKKRPPAKRPQKKRNYKAEYKRRIQLAMQKGKTRQQARGHKPQEHVIRKQRAKERAALKGRVHKPLTSAEIKSVKAWYKRFNPSAFKDIPTLAYLIEWTQVRGFKAFEQYRKVWNAARENYLREQKAGTWASRGFGYLVGLTTEAGVRPEGEEQWLYYH